MNFDHETVKHSVSEYVRDQAHTNGIESHWALMKRGYHGIYHHMSKKHLHRYVHEFAGRQNIRPNDTIDHMTHLAGYTEGRQLTTESLVASSIKTEEKNQKQLRKLWINTTQKNQW